MTNFYYNNIRKVVRLANEEGKAKAFASRAAAKVAADELAAKFGDEVKKVTVMEDAYSSDFYVRVWPLAGETGPEMIERLA